MSFFPLGLMIYTVSFGPIRGGQTIPFLFGLHGDNCLDLRKEVSSLPRRTRLTSLQTPVPPLPAHIKFPRTPVFLPGVRGSGGQFFSLGAPFYPGCNASIS